ncbi:MAG: type IV pilin protein [Chromatiales bacterium]|jgi:type IV pilus assembly protein PilE
MKKKILGVTLIELMVVVLIVGILAAFAIPSYRQYVLRANRADAKATLLRLAAAQEQFYAQNNTYTNNLAAAPPAGLGIAGTEKGYYQLNVVNADATGFTVTAAPGAMSPQLQDGACQTFTITATGVRSSINGAGADSTAECWNR